VLLLLLLHYKGTTDRMGAYTVPRARTHAHMCVWMRVPLCCARLNILEFEFQLPLVSTSVHSHVNGRLVDTCRGR